MNTLKISLSFILEHLKEIATNISETFTGSDSGAVLVMMVFYLVVLILIFLLLKGLIKLIKSFFTSSTQKKSKNPAINKDKKASTSDTNMQDVDFNNPPSEILIPSFLNEFEGQPFLNNLSQKYNNISGFDDVFNKFQPFTNASPQLLVLDKSIADEPSAEEKTELISQISTKNPDELKQFSQQLSQELNEIENKLKSIDKSLVNNCKTREKLINEELTATDKHNQAVEEFKALQEQFDANKTNVSVDYADLFNFISELDAQKKSVIEQIYSIKENIALISSKTESFERSYEENITAFLTSVHTKENTLTALKDSCLNIIQLREKTDGIISSLQLDYKNLSQKKSQLELLSSETNSKLDELARIEAERLKREAEARAAQLAAARKAQEEAERLAQLEAERKAREEAEQLEKERIAKEEAEKAAKLEAEQKTKEDVEKANENTAINETAVFDVSTNVNSEGVDINKVKKQVENQAQTAYVLNFDNLSPEMYEKLAQASEKRKKDAQKAVKLTKPTETDVEDSESDSSATESDNAETSSDADPVDQESNAGQEKAYIKELRKQWAEARAHKEEWEAECARKKAAEEARKQELSKEWSSTNKLDDTQ